MLNPPPNKEEQYFITERIGHLIADSKDETLVKWANQIAEEQVLEQRNHDKRKP